MYRFHVLVTAVCVKMHEFNFSVYKVSATSLVSWKTIAALNVFLQFKHLNKKRRH